MISPDFSVRVRKRLSLCRSPERSASARAALRLARSKYMNRKLMSPAENAIARINPMRERNVTVPIRCR